MRKQIAVTAVLCAGLLLFSGCGKAAPKAELQTGYLESSDLTETEVYTQPVSGNYEMADENAELPAAELTRYTSSDGETFSFDKAGRLCSYSSGAATGASGSAEPLKAEEQLRQTCDEVLSSYIDDYAAYTEITSQYYESDSHTYNLAMEHKIADGITDYALIRLDEKGEVLDLSISYADLDGDCADRNFVTDDDKAYFEEQVQPYLTALEDYQAAVTYTQYKHLNGKIYAFYEITYTDAAAGIEAGAKQVIFCKV